MRAAGQAGCRAREREIEQAGCRAREREIEQAGCRAGAEARHRCAVYTSGGDCGRLERRAASLCGVASCVANGGSPRSRRRSASSAQIWLSDCTSRTSRLPPHGVPHNNNRSRVSARRACGASRVCGRRRCGSGGRRRWRRPPTVRSFCDRTRAGAAAE
eukprot:5108590-Prymnesium_polylepis.1